MADDSVLQIVVRLKNEASAQFKNLQDNLDGMKKSLQPAADASNAFALGIAGAGIAVGGFAKAAIQSAADIETQRVGFKTLLGSVEEADEAIKMIQRDAASTPFEFSGLIEANKALTLVTKNAQVSEDVLLNVGKALAASGKGQAELDRIIMNLQQIGNVGKISEMDIRQFGFAGVNILELLADYYGVTKDEAGDMVKASKDAFGDLSAAFRKAGSEGGQFADAFTNAGGSFNQVVSNLKDQWNIFLSNEGAKLLEWGKQFILVLTDVIQNTLPQFISGIEKVVNFLAENQSVIYGVAGAILGALTPAIISATLAFASMALALAPWIIGGAIVGGVVAGILWIVKHWDLIKAKAIEIWTAIADFLAGIWSAISTALTSAWQAITSFLSSVWDVIKVIFIAALNILVASVIYIFNILGIDIIGIFNGIRDFFTAFWEVLKISFQIATEFIKTVWTAAWTAMRDFVIPIWTAVKNVVLSALGFVRDKIKEWMPNIKAAFNAIWEGFTGIVKTVWDTVANIIKESINGIIDKINLLINAINSVVSKGASVTGLTVPKIPNVPRLAEGGIVTRPTLALIGEAGPEAVIPLSRPNNIFGAKSGGGSVINITINNPVVRNDDDILTIRREIDSYFRPLMINNKTTA